MPDEAAALVTSLDANDAAYSAHKGNMVSLGDDKYHIHRKLSEGAFGVVYTGTKLLGEIPVVIKFEPKRCETPQLKDEYRTYQVITDRGKTQVDGIPRVYGFGPIYFHNVLVMDRFGPSLESIFAERERRFTVKTVVMLAKRMLGVVERVHAKGIVHRDLKPDNFVLGRPGTPTANMVHLIDFGMANRYKDPKTEVHIPYREGTPLLGTARYMSIHTHLGREQSRRDDLEALCYVWLYLLRGRLPWQGINAPKKEKNDRIKKKKQETTIEDICTGFPVEFSECLRYVRHLGFYDEPDYVYLQNLLSQVLERGRKVDDGKFDWVNFEGERPRLEIRPPRTPDSAAAPGKRPRAASVPDQGEIRGRMAPALLYDIAEEKEPKDYGSG